MSSYSCCALMKTCTAQPNPVLLPISPRGRLMTPDSSSHTEVSCFVSFSHFHLQPPHTNHFTKNNFATPQLLLLIPRDATPKNLQGQNNNLLFPVSKHIHWIQAPRHETSISLPISKFWPWLKSLQHGKLLAKATSPNSSQTLSTGFL